MRRIKNSWAGWKFKLVISIVLLSLISSASLAGWRPYSAGPVGPNDFNAPVPDPLPKEGGVEIKSKISVGTTISSVSYTGKTENGKVVLTATAVTIESGIDPNQSWNSDPDDPNLMDHEQGHADEEEIAVRKAQAEIDKLIKEGKLKGEGETEEEAKKDLEDKIQKIIDKHKDKKQEKYDEKTGHGTKDKEQKEERERQKKELKDANVSSDHQLGPNAKSWTSAVIYEPGWGLIFEATVIDEVFSIDPCFIPDPYDPVLGAQLVMPSFSLVGETSDGEFFFQAEVGAATMKIQHGLITFLSTEMTYMMYCPIENMFYGLGKGFISELPEGISTYVDGVCEALTSDKLTLFGVEMHPDTDFMAMTGGFMAPGVCPAIGIEGMRIVGSYPQNCLDVWAYDVGMEADLNRDCRVDFKDFAAFTNYWLQCNDPCDPNCVD